MPLTPREDSEGRVTRSQTAASQEDVAASTSSASPVQAPAVIPDLNHLIILIKEQARLQAEQARRQEEQARRQEEQLLQLRKEQAHREEEQAKRQEEQAKRQEEQAKRQEEQARRQEEQLAQLKEEQARRQEEQARRQEEQARRQEEQFDQLRQDQARRQEDLAKSLLGALEKKHAVLEKQIIAVSDEVETIKTKQVRQEDQLQQLQNKIENNVDVTLQQLHRKIENNVEVTLQQLQNKVQKMETQGGPLPAMHTGAPKIEVPHFDGTSSWAAFRYQFETVAKGKGWSDQESMMALTLALRGDALLILENLPREGRTLDALLNALDNRYSDKHLEYAYRAQLRDRLQKPNESLQQWATEIERLVRRAYVSSPELVESNILQSFIGGIRDVEVRATVRLGHHQTLQSALAHALEVEAVRQDTRPYRLREVVMRDKPSSGPICYGCGERGHIRISCPKRLTPARTTAASATQVDAQELSLN